MDNDFSRLKRDPVNVRSHAVVMVVTATKIIMIFPLNAFYRLLLFKIQHGRPIKGCYCWGGESDIVNTNLFNRPLPISITFSTTKDPSYRKYLPGIQSHSINYIRCLL